MPDIDKFLKEKKNKTSNSSNWSFSDFELPKPTKPQRRPGRDQAAIKTSKEEEKPTTNWEQTGNKVGTKPTTNWEQTGNKVGTEISEIKETGNKVDTQPGTLSGTKWEQTGNKVGTDPDVLSLVGLQKKITFLLYNLCRSKGTLSTGQLTCEWISESCESTVQSVKVTLRRLEKKGFINREKFKNGRGGWTIYKVPEAVYKGIFHLESCNKLGTKWEQSGNKVVSKLGTQPGTTPSVVVVDNINNNINTTTTQNEDLFKKQAEEIYIYDPLRKAGIGESHIIRLLQENISAPDIQRSLAYLAFQIGQTEHNIKNPVALFMSGMRNHGCLTPPAGYSQWAAQIKNQYDNEKQNEVPISAAELENAFTQCGSKN